jgi:hypothetical protein
MLHKNILLIIVLVFSLFVISQVHAQGLEFSDVKEKIIQTGKYEIRITGDEFEWVEDVQIDKGYIKIIAKEEKDRKKAMPEKISVYSKSKTKEKELTKYKDKGKDIFLMEWNHEIEYKKIGENSIEIIEIVDADHLDSNRNFIEDIYNEVYKLDNITKIIPSGDYIRIKFEQNLSSKKDITIYAKGNDFSYVEVYEKDSDYLLGTFDEINGTLLNYRIILTELGDTEQDTFDLKILGGSVEFDYITDPTYENYTTGQAVYGVFADGVNTNYLNLTSQVRACSSSDCSGDSWNTYTNNSFSDLLSLTSSSHFQFRSLFSTENQNYTPYLFNFTIHYGAPNESFGNLYWERDSIKILTSSNVDYIFFNSTDTINQEIRIYNLNRTLLYNTNGSIYGSSNINDNNGNINITLPPNNTSYILDNFNLTEGTTRANSPLTLTSSTDGIIKTYKITSSLLDPINTKVVVNVDCTRVARIEYTSENGAYTQSWEIGDYICSNNLVELDITGIEYATGSNTLLVYLNQGRQTVCDEANASFADAVALAGILLTVVLVAGALSILFLGFSGVIDLGELTSQIEGIKLSSVLSAVMIIGLLFLMIATLVVIFAGSYC